MAIICTLVVCIAICIVVLEIFKISKSGNKSIEKGNVIHITLLLSAYICSFVALFLLLKEYNEFDMVKYLGLCSYWLFAGVALYLFLNQIVLEKKDKQTSFKDCSVELVKNLTFISLLSILWVVSNTLLGKSKYTIFSVPVIMLVWIFIILVRFILMKRNMK